MKINVRRVLTDVNMIEHDIEKWMNQGWAYLSMETLPVDPKAPFKQNYLVLFTKNE